MKNVEVVQHFGSNERCFQMGFGKAEDIRKHLSGAFSHCTGGIPHNMWTEDSRAQVEHTLKQFFPIIRKSSLRMFMEGHLTPDERGNPCPPTYIPTGVRMRLEMMCSFLDIIEQMRAQRFGGPTASPVPETPQPKSATKPKPDNRKRRGKPTAA